MILSDDHSGDPEVWYTCTSAEGASIIIDVDQKPFIVDQEKQFLEGAEPHNCELGLELYKKNNGRGILTFPIYRAEHTVYWFFWGRPSSEKDD